MKRFQTIVLFFSGVLSCDTSWSQTNGSYAVALLAEANHILEQSGSITRPQLGQASNLILTVSWSLRKDHLRYRDQILDYISGKNDGWHIRPPTGMEFLMMGSGFVWWTTYRPGSNSARWSGSLDETLSTYIYDGFSTNLRTNATPSPIPEDAYLIEIVRQTDKGPRGDFFYIKDTTSIDSLLETIKLQGARKHPKDRRGVE